MPENTFTVHSDYEQIYGDGGMPIRQVITGHRVEINSDGITLHGTFPTGDSTMDRTEVIRSRVASLEAELAEREKFGKDFFEDGEVLIFSGNFGNTAGKKYRYAAIKAAGTWHITGQANAGSYLTWSALVDFFIKANVRKVRVVRTTQHLF